MSRTFEVLERAQQDQELFRVPPVTRTVPGNGQPANSKASLPDPDAFTREEVLRLVRSLFLASNGNGHGGVRRVVFCGIDDPEGSSLLCSRVSRTLADQVQSQVCVVDANVRTPEASPLFDLPPYDTSHQSKNGDAHKPMRQVADNLWLVSSDLAPTNGAAPALERMRACIKGLGDEFAYVVISAPPIGSSSDATLLGQLADGVVLVLEANSTRRVTAKKAKEALEAANVRLLGTVLNNRTFAIPERLYHLL
jgi:Mrp family chromosome partitioning ATPase